MSLASTRRALLLIVAATLLASTTAFAQPYGLPSRGSIAAYLNGQMPSTDPGDPSNAGIPTTLSALGIFSNLAALTPNQGLIPYQLINPLWSDGAVKARWMAMPYDSGQMVNPTIGFAPTGEWTFPQGTVFVKQFDMVVNEQTLEKRKLETRILVRVGNNIYGRTYKWRPDQLDADLLSGGMTEPLTITEVGGTTRMQNYTYPSPQQCKQCHNTAFNTNIANGVIGPKTRQLNSDLTYTPAIAAGGSGVTDNQLRTWNHLGMFDTPLNENDIPTYTKVAALGDTTASLEKRSRSYIDSNCAYCHRPAGPGPIYDGRYDTPILDQNLAGSATLNPGAVLWRNDLTANSHLLNRDSLTSPAGGMPPIAKNVVDQNWISTLSAWITYAFDLVSTNVPGNANNKVRALFNSDLDPAAATTLANYAFDGGVTVTGAVLEPDKRTVTLTTSPMAPGTLYRLTVNRVQEAAVPGNPVWPNSNRTFANSAPPVTLLLEFASYAVNEGAGSLTVNVFRTGASGAVSVNYGTADGTALAGQDYTATSGTLNWANGDTSTKSFTIPIVNDARAEGPETFTVFLSNATGGAVIGDRLSATVTIADDDGFDFSGDGKADLLWRNTDGRQAIYLMDGLATLATQEIIGAGTGWTVTQAADFNGDGKRDLLWQHTDGRIAIYLMNGTTPTATQQVLNAGGGWNVTHTPDLDGDGKADLIFQNTDGTMAAWLMNGTAMASGTTLLGAGSGWSVIRTGDFDGDGKDDLVWQHTDGRVAIWLMNGLTAKSTLQILNAGTGWTVTHTADFNGDGKSDLVWQNVDGSIAIWLMNGTTMTSGSGLLGAGTGWSITRTGDFDGDGKADLFFLHTDGRAAIYLMNGLAPTQTTQILNAGGGWSAKRVQDMNGDGKADIVWENVDGSVAIWLMNGAALASGSGILGAGTGWSVSGVNP
ncbi:hypothetical protein BWI17_14565 [Betaproteobacteria bacterium GR16-43]|nr:hypothetical protein BWI17_14565 [Betaproteobacteria bacterium GR16-43]